MGHLLMEYFDVKIFQTDVGAGLWILFQWDGEGGRVCWNMQGGWNEGKSGRERRLTVCFESGGSLTLLLSCHLPVPPEWQEGEGCTNLGIASPAFHQIRGCLSFRQLTVRLRLSWKLILKTERKVICLKVWSWTSGFMYRGAVFSGRIVTFDICSQTPWKKKVWNEEVLLRGKGQRSC